LLQRRERSPPLPRHLPLFDLFLLSLASTAFNASLVARKMDVNTPSISTTPSEHAAAPLNTQDASPTRPPQTDNYSSTAAPDLAEASTSKQDAPQANGVAPAVEGESKKRAATSEEGAVKDGSTTKDDGAKGDAEPAKKKRKQDKGPELYCHQGAISLFFSSPPSCRLGSRGRGH
jgi:hypothetical protein